MSAPQPLTGDELANVREFVRQWEAQMQKPNGGKTDLIYSVFFDMDAEEIALHCSDLARLVAEVELLRDGYMLATDAKRLNDRYAKARTRNNELAAEVERLRATVDDAHELADEWAEMEPKIVALMERSDYVSELRAALNDAPQR